MLTSWRAKSAVPKDLDGAMLAHNQCLKEVLKNSQEAPLKSKTQSSVTCVEPPLQQSVPAAAAASTDSSELGKCRYAIIIPIYI